MSRYTTLCVFLIAFALFENVLAAPKGSSSDGGSSRSFSGVTHLVQKVRTGLSALGSKIGKAWKVSANRLRTHRISIEKYSVKLSLK